MLAIQNDREWARFATQVLGSADLVTDARFDRAAHRFAHTAELTDIITDRFSRLTGPECDRLLDEAEVAHSRQRDIAEVPDHPQLTERDRWRPVETPAGTISMTLPPVTMSGVEYPMGPIPAVGAQTDAILADLGYADDAIAGLRRRGVL